MNEEVSEQSQYLRLKQKLPKLPINKVDEANSFMSDPRAAIKQIIQNRKRKTYNKDFGLISKTQRLLSPIPTQIQDSVLYQTINKPSPKDQKQMERQKLKAGFQSQRQLISLKLKKFRPTNGSYTQFYKEKLSIGHNKTKKNLQGIPQISFNQILNKSKIAIKTDRKKTQRQEKQIQATTLTISQEKVIKEHKDLMQKRRKMTSNNSVNSENYETLNFRKKNTQQRSYNNKLTELRTMWKEDSRQLLKQAQFACVQNQKNYEKLKIRFSGEAKYEVDEQILPRIYK